MASAADFLSQLTELNQGISATPDRGQATRDIRGEINKLVDFGRPILQDTANVQERAFGTLPRIAAEFRDTPADQRGSAINTLGSGLGEFGRLLGLRDVFSGIAGRQGSRIEDIIGSATDAFLAPQEAREATFNRLFPLFQTQTELEESQRERDFQAEQNRLSRASSASNLQGGVQDIQALLDSLLGSGAPNITETFAQQPQGRILQRLPRNSFRNVPTPRQRNLSSRNPSGFRIR